MTLRPVLKRICRIAIFGYRLTGGRPISGPTIRALRTGMFGSPILTRLLSQLARRQVCRAEYMRRGKTYRCQATSAISFKKICCFEAATTRKAGQNFMNSTTLHHTLSGRCPKWCLARKDGMLLDPKWAAAENIYYIYVYIHAYIHTYIHTHIRNERYNAL